MRVVRPGSAGTWRAGLALALGALAGGSERSHAQMTQSQTVFFRVAPETRASVSPSRLALTTNDPNRKISVSLDQAMPAGSRLQIVVSAPAGVVTSAGRMTLGTQGADLVTEIAPTALADLALQYVIDGAPIRGQRVVRYTVIAGP